jgi:PAS domain S-box-containing protein
MLEHSHESLRAIADAIPYPVMYIEANGNVGFTNRAFRRANRAATQPATGRSVEDVLSEAERENGRAAFLQCLLEGRRATRDGESALPGAPVRFCRYVYEPVRGTDGVVLGVCVTVVDLTEIKAAEEALKASHRELERSNKDLEQFAYVASHDLKAPLRAVEVLVGWLAEDLADHKAGDVQENLALLKARTARLNRLLDDLLAYSRAGRRNGEIGVVDTRELIEDVWSLLAVPDAFSLTVAGDLPTLTTFRGPLEQVLRNLIGNAVKHHPGPRGRITVRADLSDAGCDFSVADDGAGIPEEYRDRIYQMFQTLKPRDDLEGSGMGLAIVSRIVEWQGGRVWHEPGPAGVGTVFKFVWKAQAAEAVDSSQDMDGSRAA